MADGPPRAYDPNTPVQLQAYDWTCSIRSTSWCLSSLGYPTDPVVQATMMVEQGYVSEAKGCLDATGAGLAEFVRVNYDLPAFHIDEPSWAEVCELAGRYPLALGGRGMYHWVAARYVDSAGGLQLANPAPGYAGLGQLLTEGQFWSGGFGPWGLMCINWEAVPEENPYVIAELEAEVARLTTHNHDLISAIGYLQGDVADAIQSSHDAMVLYASTGGDAQFVAAVEAQQAAINSLRSTGQ